jgi:hypothetical protein
MHSFPSCAHSTDQVLLPMSTRACALLSPSLVSSHPYFVQLPLQLPQWPTHAAVTAIEKRSLTITLRWGHLTFPPYPEGSAMVSAFFAFQSVYWHLNLATNHLSTFQFSKPASHSSDLTQLFKIHLCTSWYAHQAGASLASRYTLSLSWCHPSKQVYPLTELVPAQCQGWSLKWLTSEW